MAQPHTFENLLCDITEEYVIINDILIIYTTVITQVKAAASNVSFISDACEPCSTVAATAGC